MSATGKVAEMPKRYVIPAVIVEKGDTLSAIAERDLGRASAWRILAAANAIPDPRKLEVGRLLVIGAPLAR